MVRTRLPPFPRHAPRMLALLSGVLAACSAVHEEPAAHVWARPAPGVDELVRARPEPRPAWTRDAVERLADGGMVFTGASRLLPTEQDARDDDRSDAESRIVDHLSADVLGELQRSGASDLPAPATVRSEVVKLLARSPLAPSSEAYVEEWTHWSDARGARAWKVWVQVPLSNDRHAELRIAAMAALHSAAAGEPPRTESRAASRAALSRPAAGREEQVRRSLDETVAALEAALAELGRGDALAARLSLVRCRERLAERARDLDSLVLERQKDAVDEWLDRNVPGMPGMSSAQSTETLRALLERARTRLARASASSQR